jgi:hypothetical protein
MRAVQGEKHLNPPPKKKKRFIPQYGRQFCYEENLSMARGKPQQREMTKE